MDQIEKLLRKISKKDRQRLFEIITLLVSGKRCGFDIKKLQNSDFYRIRVGRFRIIFHYEQKKVIIDSVRLRDDTTYNKIS